MKDTEMKKPDRDELQLRLQEYTRETPVNRDRHVEHLAADLPMAGFTDSPPDEEVEYRH
jgi:hypothetical protein